MVRNGFLKWCVQCTFGLTCESIVSPKSRSTPLVDGLREISGWWFQIFFIFIPIWGRFPFWLIFFRGVGTTNQDLCWSQIRSFLNIIAYTPTWSVRAFAKAMTRHPSSIPFWAISQSDILGKLQFQCSLQYKGLSPHQAGCNPLLRIFFRNKKKTLHHHVGSLKRWKSKGVCNFNIFNTLRKVLEIEDFVKDSMFCFFTLYIPCFQRRPK